MASQHDRAYSHFTYADFGRPGRRALIGRHVSAETAIRQVNRWIGRIYGEAGEVRGRVWVETFDGRHVYDYRPRGAAVASVSA